MNGYMQCQCAVDFFFFSPRQNCRLNGFYVLSIRFDGERFSNATESKKQEKQKTHQLSENDGRKRVRSKEKRTKNRQLFSVWLVQEIVIHSMDIFVFVNFLFGSLFSAIVVCV